MINKSLEAPSESSAPVIEVELIIIPNTGAIETLATETMPATSVDDIFPLPQKVAQGIYRYAVSAASPILYMPTPTFPYSNILVTSVISLGGITADIFAALVSKPNPLSGLTAYGNGDFSKGFLKIATSEGVAVISGAWAGFGISTLIDHYGPSLVASSNASVAIIGNIVTHTAFDLFGVGTLCYFVTMGISKLSMKAWEHFLPGMNEKTQKGEVNLLQKAGTYLIRFALDVSFVETIIYLGRLGNRNFLTHNEHQILTLIGCDTVKQLLEYFCFVPHPISSLVPRNAKKKTTHEKNNFLSENTKAICKKALILGLKECLLISSVYAINAFTCVIASSEDSDLCTKDEFFNRMPRYAISIGIPLLADYLITNVGPKACGKLSSLLPNKWYGFFCRPCQDSKETKPAPTPKLS